jgi:dihydropteroate synthase
MKLISRNRSLDLSETKIMGILNITPDSFSDGGQFTSLDKALYQAEEMIKNGATFIDIGGESTRPNAEPVALSEELDRVIPIIEALRSRFDCWLSIDTSKAVVMKEAVNAGADLINDVYALQKEGALEAALMANVPVCLMHMQGNPETMQTAPNYSNIIENVSDFFHQRLHACEKIGILKNRILLDPGFGFGKTLTHNYQLLANLAHFQDFSLPILVGMSRKSMIYNPLAQTPLLAVSGSITAASLASLNGAHIVRVHDVRQTKDALMICRLMQEQKIVSNNK